MLNIFNRAELTVTNDLNRQAVVRDALAGAGIDYQIKTVNRNSPSPFAAGRRAYTGTMFENPASFYTYYIYVHKKDLERAQYILRQV